VVLLMWCSFDRPLAGPRLGALQQLYCWEPTPSFAMLCVLSGCCQQSLSPRNDSRLGSIALESFRNEYSPFALRLTCKSLCGPFAGGGPSQFLYARTLGELIVLAGRTTAGIAIGPE